MLTDIFHQKSAILSKNRFDSNSITNMKKLIVVFLFCLSLTAVAQNQIKRVAILETVDKECTVSYMKLLQFRSNLTTAITNTEGYEGYDRVDMKQIIGEQNFQRTGLVSDADIKKIGEFTGAQYVLIAEAASDGSNMFITAKIIDVETALILRNSNRLMGTSATEMQEGSQKVAADLLGVQFNKNENLQTVNLGQGSGSSCDIGYGTRARGLVYSINTSISEEGQVYVEVHVLADGTVSEAHVINNDIHKTTITNRQIQQQCVQEARRAKYEPGKEELRIIVFSGGACDYNTALIQLLDYNYSGCQNTLDCITQKDAKIYYLAAVLAARTKNEEQFYTNLSKAFALEPSYKITARRDAEFKRFRHSEKFKEITK